MQTVVCLYRCLMAIIDSVLLNCLPFDMQAIHMERSRNSVKCNHLPANTFNLSCSCIKYFFNTKTHLADQLIIHVNRSATDRYPPKVKAVKYHAFTCRDITVTTLLY